jgi:hypothetical protein
MRLRRMIVMLTVACGLSLGLSQAVSPAYAASAAPVAHLTAHAPAAAKAASPSTGQTGKIIPNIQFRDCSNQRTTWVDIDFLNIAAGVLQDWCFGYTGRWQFSSNSGWTVTNFCSGNNRGAFSYSYRGNYHIFNFLPGQYYAFASGTVPISLTISGWSGSYQCVS